LFGSRYAFGKKEWLAALVALGFALLLGGCGNNSQVDTSAAPMTPSGSPTTNVAVSGPAVSESVAFTQLALETSVKRTKNQNGQVFLRFRYADNDGSIYDCELPEAMSKGTYSVAEWARTFNAYRLPKVVGHKKTDKTVQTVGDFPFISPKPKETPKPAQAQKNPNIEIPKLPAMPAPSATPSAAPPGMPNPMMRGPGPMAAPMPGGAQPPGAGNP